MKINTLLKLTSAIFLFFFVLIGWCIFSLVQNLELKDQTTESQRELGMLAVELQSASDYLTNEVRAYTQFGEQMHFDNYWTEVNETQTRERVVSRLEELNVPQEMLALVEEARQNSNDLITLEEDAMAAVEEGDLTEARSLVYGPEYDAGKEIIAAPLSEFNTQLNDWAAGEVAASENKVGFSLLLMIISAILIIGFIIAVYSLLFTKIRPLSILTDQARQIADGDLRVEELPAEKNDEISDLTRSFNEMVQNLRALLLTTNTASENLAASSEELLASAEQTNAATQQVSTSIDDIHRGTEDQLKHTHQTTLSMKEVAEGIQLIANTSSTVKKAAEETNEKSHSGEKKVNDAVAQMRLIEEDVGFTADSIRHLNERSKEIEGIVNVISTISDQTNLLALNAAIEAARAGEAGKGFAVVADEVRKLAEESNRSAQQISELIRSIQSQTLSTVQQMDHVSLSVQKGTKVINETGETFKGILISANEVASQIQEVSAVSEQMAVTAHEVTSFSDAMNDIAQNSSDKTQQVSALAQEQYASMEEISSSAEALSTLAVDLNDQLKKFQL